MMHQYVNISQYGDVSDVSYCQNSTDTVCVCNICS